MIVKFTKRSAGPDGVIRPGDTLEVSEREAELLINGEYAVPVAAPADQEQSVARPEAEKPNQSNRQKKRSDKA